MRTLDFHQGASVHQAAGAATSSRQDLVAPQHADGVNEAETIRALATKAQASCLHRQPSLTTTVQHMLGEQYKLAPPAQPCARARVSILCRVDLYLWLQYHQTFAG